jgi:hypothetical protein
MSALQELLTNKKSKLSRLKKEHRKSAASASKVKLEKQIIDLENFIHHFRVSVMEPVQIDDIVINYKLYKAFMKKLKGFKVSEKIDNNTLIINYGKGELHLYDLTHHFPEGSEFPEGELHVV